MLFGFSSTRSMILAAHPQVHEPRAVVFRPATSLLRQHCALVV